MNVILYINSSDNRTLNKSISEGVEISDIFLLRPANILTPVFVIDEDSYSNENYLYCNEFGRYYYISDVVHLTGNRVELHCNVDVLMSYQEEIKELRCVINRASDKYNVLLNDVFKMPLSVSDTVNKKLSSGEFTNTLNATSYCILLTVYGGV